MTLLITTIGGPLCGSYGLKPNGVKTYSTNNSNTPAKLTGSLPLKIGHRPYRPGPKKEMNASSKPLESSGANSLLGVNPPIDERTELIDWEVKEAIPTFQVFFKVT